MLTLCYFASLRDVLGVDREAVELPEQVQTVSDLMVHLGNLRGDKWQSALASKLICTAVNQEICSSDKLITPGDEVAFFPPVTGG
ncbi:molybdopterin converting factor subunit 1 [uncultured Amphritea sp.]|uniref:molybdopterin converting factor subunit 1 n=1 Tax=Amphritea sp. TaxID=1872502 RepID=UPI0025F8EF91|nr:molybdopterin converting factor subunit 1 [uncultured Amphritea sp.]